MTIIGTPGIGGGMVLQNAVAHGILSTETVLDGQNYYQLGASVNAGNSGGPALDSSGEVIGVVTSKARGREAIGFCIPVGDVARALVRMDHLDRGDQARLERIHNVEALRTACTLSAVCTWRCSTSTWPRWRPPGPEAAPRMRESGLPRERIETVSLLGVRPSWLEWRPK